MARKRSASGRTTRSLAKPLARVGDPLVLASGQVVEPTLAGGVKVEKFDAKPHEFKSSKRRNIGELPAEARVLNGIFCVFAYTLLGVGEREIADAMRISASQVKEIRKHPGYAEIFELIQSEFINVNSELIQARIAAMGNDAVDEVYQLMRNGKQEGTRLRAGENIVEWGGHSKLNGAKGGLGHEAFRIVVTNGEQSTEVTIGGSEIMPN